MKPLISYYGGKQKIVKKILPLVPEHKIYVEPFCGGATLFFAKEPPKITNISNYREVLNDNNLDLINLYRVAQTKPQQLLSFLNSIPYSEWYYYNYKNNHDKIIDDVEKAAAFYIRIMMSFANKCDAGFAFSKYGENNAATYFNHLKRLPEIVKRLQGVYIFCRDAIDIIHRFDCKDAFFYCDPPYPGTNQGHYKGYTKNDFEKLVDTLDKCEGKFLLSCYENAYIPDNWERFEIKTCCSSSNTANNGHREKRTEIVYAKSITFPNKQFTFFDFRKKTIA